MTSKSLFCNLMKEDLKRRLWSIALAGLVFFLSMPVVTAMMLSNAGSMSYEMTNRVIASYVVEDVLALLRPQGWMCVVAVAGSLICGMNGFFYLHSRQKVDLYHSVPVRRETIFAVHYINGILIYALPYLICTLLTIGISGASGFFTGHGAELWSAAFTGLCFNLCFYLLLYSFVVLAMLVTGNLVVGAGVYAIFCGYGLAVYGLKDVMYGIFFDTFASDIFSSGYWYARLSPLSWYIYQATAYYETGWLPGKALAITVFAAVLVTALAILLYRMRPSESAGKALAFSKVKPVVKVLLTVPSALLCGVLFRSINSSFKGAWFVFGLIFGLIVVGAIVEIVMQFDFKAAFSGKKSLAFSVVLVAAIASIFQFDIFGYDRYLPQKEKVACMGVQSWEFHQNREFVNTSDFMEKMRVTEFDTLYQLAELGVAYANKDLRESNGADISYMSYTIGYELTGGKRVYRRYYAPKEDVKALYPQIFDNAEYREDSYPFLKEAPEEILEIQTNVFREQKLLSLSDADKIRLAQTYQKELKSLTYEEMMSGRAIGSIQFETKTIRDVYSRRYPNRNETTWVNWAEEYPVYESFTETRAILEAAGMHLNPSDHLDEVEEIFISLYEKVEAAGGMEESEVFYKDTYEEKIITITDQEQMKEILDTMIISDYSLPPFVETFEGEILVRLKENEDGYSENVYGYFIEGQVPAFVEKLIREK